MKKPILTLNRALCRKFLTYQPLLPPNVISRMKAPKNSQSHSSQKQFSINFFKKKFFLTKIYTFQIVLLQRKLYNVNKAEKSKCNEILPKIIFKTQKFCLKFRNCDMTVTFMYRNIKTTSIPHQQQKQQNKK